VAAFIWINRMTAFLEDSLRDCLRHALRPKERVGALVRGANKAAKRPGTDSSVIVTSLPPKSSRIVSRRKSEYLLQLNTNKSRTF
jgi:hypothetical protein